MTLLEDAMHELFGFLGASEPQEWLPLFIPIVATIMIFSIPIAAIITEYFQKRNRARVMEKAIEKGVPVETLKIEDEGKPQRLPYRSGMVTVAVGIGCMVVGTFLARILSGSSDTDARAAGPMIIGSGILVMLIGIALLINDRMNYKRFFENGNNGR
jgi:hypothetical protein